MDEVILRSVLSLESRPVTADASNPLSSATIHGHLPQLIHFLRLVRRRREVLGGCLLVAGVLGAVYFATATRYYEARASLLVSQTGSDVWTTSMTPEGGRQALMPTYARLISSAVVTDRAVEMLRPADLVDVGKAPAENWAAILRHNLSVSTVRRTNIIEVAYRSRRPEAAVAVVNAVVRSYQDFMHETHKGTAGELIDILTREKVNLDTRLQQATNELLTLRHEVGDLGIKQGDAVTHPVLKQALQLNEALIEARKERISLEATLAAITGAVERGEDVQQHMLTLADSVGREVVLSGLGFSQRDAATIAKLEQQLIDDQAELGTLLEYYGPAHPQVVEVRDRVRISRQFLAEYQDQAGARVDQLRQQRLGPMLIAMARQKLNAAWQHERSLEHGWRLAQAEAAHMSGSLAQLGIKEHEIDLLRRQHDVLLDQIANIDLVQDQGDVRTALISQPRLPQRPVAPRLSLVMFLCLAAGGGSGLLLAYVLDVLDDRFQSPDELQAQLDAPILAMIRDLPTHAPEGPAALQVVVAPDAVESEAFRTLRTALSLADRPSRRLVVTSSEPEDGKTTVLANLAAAFALAGKRTLLIDADLRRPGLTNLLGLRGPGGLAEVLRDGETPLEVALERALHAGYIENLDVLACGTRPANPAELLSSQRFADLLAWAESRYDQVLVDSPPALAASDTVIVGRQVDGVILVVRPDKNQRRPVLRAADSFLALGVELLGVVVNRLGAEASGDYYGYGGGYGYGYGAGYGADFEDDEASAAHHVDHDGMSEHIGDAVGAGLADEVAGRSEPGNATLARPGDGGIDLAWRDERD